MNDFDRSVRTATSPVCAVNANMADCDATTNVSVIANAGSWFAGTKPSEPNVATPFAAPFWVAGIAASAVDFAVVAKSYADFTDAGVAAFVVDVDVVESSSCTTPAADVEPAPTVNVKSPVSAPPPASGEVVLMVRDVMEAADAAASPAFVVAIPAWVVAVVEAASADAWAASDATFAVCAAVALIALFVAWVVAVDALPAANVAEPAAAVSAASAAACAASAAACAASAASTIC